MTAHPQIDDARLQQGVQRLKSLQDLPPTGNRGAESSLLDLKLIRATDKLNEALDFCEAIAMAAVDLDDPRVVGVFQSLASVAKDKVCEAIATIDAARGTPEAKQ
ncbi:hypothetical protein [Sinorhizobium meliloti]|uniref:hypothetical protein n=1 Tax=Rhizobium meliloti TaxID=382 RepID=UPI000489C6EE|nr:hypothetical protein [Sinorhizobium meliloti]MDE4620632.1 hypothetical protein [Sinorhizobium meliloti]